MEKKMTKKEMFAMIMVETENAEIKAFCKNEIALLNKKSASKKAKALTEDEVANIETVRGLIADRALKVSEIINQGEWVGEMPSTPKVTAWLKKLGATRVVEGKNVTFTLAEPLAVAVELETEEVSE